MAGEGLDLAQGAASGRLAACSPAFLLPCSAVQCSGTFCWAIISRLSRSIPPPCAQQIADLPARPPPLRLRGWLQRCLGYLGPVLLVSDAELMQTAGLDALVRSCGGALPDPTAVRAGFINVHRLPPFGPAIFRCSCDAHAPQILCRTLMLGLQMYIPLSAVCCGTGK